MIKKILTVMMIYLAIPLFSKTMDVDDTKGFRDVNFGDDISKFPDMLYQASLFPGDGYYIRSSDRMLLGDIELSWISYRFFMGKFYLVEIITKNGEGRYDLLNSFVEKYGKGENIAFKLAFDDAKTVWEGKNVKIEYYDKKDSTKLRIAFKPIFDKSADAQIKYYKSEEKEKKDKINSDL
jgi:hypothetical protein